VYEADIVDVAQRLGQPGGQLQHGVLGQRSRLRHHFLQRRAGDIGGGQPRRVVVGPGRDHRGRVPAVDRLRRGHLAPEPAHERGVAGQVGVDDLDRDRPAAGRRPQVHPAHPAGPEPGVQAELPDNARIVRAKRKHRPPIRRHAGRHAAAAPFPPR
jgi:hypothetical protein